MFCRLVILAIEECDQELMKLFKWDISVSHLTGTCTLLKPELLSLLRQKKLTVLFTRQVAGDSDIYC